MPITNWLISAYNCAIIRATWRMKLDPVRSPKRYISQWIDLTIKNNHYCLRCFFFILSSLLILGRSNHDVYLVTTMILYFSECFSCGLTCGSRCVYWRPSWSQVSYRRHQINSLSSRSWTRGRADNLKCQDTTQTLKLSEGGLGMFFNFVSSLSSAFSDLNF